MLPMPRVQSVLLTASVFFGTLANCSSSKMSGTTPTTPAPPETVPASTTPAPGAVAGPQPQTADGPPAATPVVANNSAPNANPNPAVTDTNNTAPPNKQNFTACSNTYQVFAKSSLYMAGVPATATARYAIHQGDGPNDTDNAVDEAPVLVAPINTTCLAPGQALYFSVAGQISHGGGDITGGNGDLGQIVPHQLGSLFGKSNIQAPINSLVGVFLSAADPDKTAAPEGLDFSSGAARDYLQFTPKIGQIFFIGNGRTTSGAYHQVIVPQGATRLYFGIMDSYQWNNNSGSLSGAVMVKAP